MEKAKDRLCWQSSILKKNIYTEEVRADDTIVYIIEDKFEYMQGPTLCTGKPIGKASLINNNYF